MMRIRMLYDKRSSSRSRREAAVWVTVTPSYDDPALALWLTPSKPQMSTRTPRLASNTSDKVNSNHFPALHLTDY